MPFQANWLSFTALDLEVRNWDSLLVYENDAGLICSDCQDHVEIVVAPGRSSRLQTVRERVMTVKKQRHISYEKFKFKL